ncbi:serine/threonine-protein kinase [Mycobacterium sp. 852002-51057_SCH5723018]|uniref:serine/threonine-protein kinase n=1 Tax=Mycobacterium sp. 852002-51057_SCH5723018 TaxID=1834094 RepID=UPI0007FCA3A4|nr:serine/threonine-protein kinase [Mycobacterium sp. 852002-51057_SCH5723018]OBG19265.1 serine/threonine protein kinase [Mycobacterium sp. 852002-51057_SCH5723018]
MDSRVGTTYGKYKITRLLGKGGGGTVYEAYDTGKRRNVALKILADQLSSDETFRMRFQRESQAAAILQEPHVIPIHDWGEIDGSLYIDMRLVQGQTLLELIAEGPLAPSRAVAVIGQVAEALDAAHAEGLIHRDVKPQNIIVTPTDFVYLVDFGIAEGRGDPRLTTAGTQIGTLNYMAPERFSDGVTTPAVDVYALACVLYESLTGHAPFTGDSLEHLVAAHIASPPPRPSVANPRVPAALDDVVARGMAKHPDDRYGTAGALGRAAQRALRGSPADADGTRPYVVGVASMSADATVVSGGAPATERGDRGAPDRRRGWVLPTVIAVAAALILAGIGVVIGMLVHKPAEQPQVPAARAALPPLVTGPDQSILHQSCDQGFTLPTATGFGTHAGRGTPETSCLFANSVLTSYWAEYGNASPLPRAVSAPGAVDCKAVPGALCNGSNFLMHCQQLPGDSWITCTGGSGARVYLW